MARFQLASSTVRILQPGESKDAPEDAQVATTQSGPLSVTGVPGLTSQVNVINQFLRGFGRPFWIKNERESCGFVIHGGHGTGKTFILQRIAATNWGRVHWIRSTDKLSSIRETFKLAQSQQPSLLFIDGLEDILAKERSNRDSVIEALGEELDNLSAAAAAANALPQVVVIATCLDYLADVPAKLQKRSRFRENVALPIPRATERLEILRFFDPPIQAEEKEACLASLASKTHAYNGDDLANLVLNAKKILGNRLDDEAAAITTGNAGTEAAGNITSETQQPREHYLTSQDMEQALRITRPTAMHDINLKPPTIHWRDVGGQASLKKVLSRMIKNTKVGHTCFPLTVFGAPCNIMPSLLLTAVSGHQSLFSSCPPTAPQRSASLWPSWLLQDVVRPGHGYRILLQLLRCQGCRTPQHVRGRV
jgi:AAA family ATPase